MPSPYPEDLLNDALELDPAERRGFLERACQADDELLNYVLGLLDIAESNPALIEFPESDGLPALEVVDAVRPPVLRHPERIGKYEVRGFCGAGGMGVVYKALDPQLGRLVALKVFTSALHGGGEGERSDRPALWAPTHTSALDRRQRERLEREARVLATLNHPNIATIYALEYEGRVPYLVMEYVDGKNLAEIAAEDHEAASTDRAGDAAATNRPEGLRLSSDEIARRLAICQDVAAAIEVAHAHGIIHRDLKPSNVMVSTAGVVKVVDFGIAKVTPTAPPVADEGVAEESAGPRHRTTNATHTVQGGTPAYMSPEQRRGEPIDHRSDIWSFGRLLQEWIPGRTDALSEICLRDSPADRLQTMREVRAQLRSLQHHLERAPGRRRRVGAILTGAMILGLLGVALTWIVLRVGGSEGASRDRQVPVSAVPVDRGVRVNFDRGREQYFALPDSIPGLVTSSWILHGKSEPQVVLGETGTGQPDRGRSLVCWNATGKVLANLGTTRDSPFVEDALDPLHGPKWISNVFPPKSAGDRLTVVECAHYFTSTLRDYEVDGDIVRDRLCLYHEGHINSVLRSPGLVPGTEMLWLAGRIRDGGLLRETANGKVDHTEFLACFDGDMTGTRVAPAFDRPSQSFLALHSEPVLPAEPILYLVIRWCVGDEGLSWDDPGEFRLDDVMSSGAGDYRVLLLRGMRIDFTWRDASHVVITASDAGELRPVMQARAALRRESTESCFRRFAADSLLVLGMAREDLQVEGDFKDIRSRLPSRWVNTEGAVMPR